MIFSCSLFWKVHPNFASVALTWVREEDSSKAPDQASGFDNPGERLLSTAQHWGQSHYAAQHADKKEGHERLICDLLGHRYMSALFSTAEVLHQILSICGNAERMLIMSEVKSLSCSFSIMWFEFVKVEHDPFYCMRYWPILVERNLLDRFKVISLDLWRVTYGKTCKTQIIRQWWCDEIINIALILW